MFSALPVSALRKREHWRRAERAAGSPRSTSVREGRGLQSAHTGRAQAGVYHQSCSSQTEQITRSSYAIVKMLEESELPDAAL